MSLLNQDENDLHERNVGQFIKDFKELINPETIRKVYYEVLSCHEDAKIRKFVPIFVTQEVKIALSQEISKINNNR